MDFPIHIDTIYMDLPILYMCLKGLQVDFFYFLTCCILGNC